MRITKYDVFISYSRRDYTIADKIVNALNAGGFTYFRDQQGIESGSDFLQLIINAIDNSRLFLCVLSENAYSSEFVIKELEYALLQKDIIVFPVVVDHSPLPDRLGFLITGLNVANWHFSSGHNVEDIIIRDVSRALGFLDSNLSKKEKEQNAVLAKIRQEGSDDYIPHLIDVDIFMSYRRADGLHYARNIMQALKMVGYPKVFFDYNSLRDGVFNTQIIDAIYSCKDFILVISPLALKNCAREGDWVAKEIRTALKYDKHIIPVVIEDTFIGWPKDFPDDMHAIKDIQFHKLMTDEYFEDSIQKLKARLITIESETSNISLFQATQATIQPSPETVTYKIKVDRKCRLIIDDEEIQVMEAFKLIKVLLPKGEYIRKVVDIEDENNFKEDVLVLNQERAELIQLSNH